MVSPRLPSSREQELEAQVTALRAVGWQKEHVIAELSEELIEAKPFWGPLTRRWCPYDLRDVVVDFLRSCTSVRSCHCLVFITWSGISSQVLRLGGALRQSKRAQCP